MSPLPRRALLAAGAVLPLAAARPARAQATSLDLPPGLLPVKPDDTVAPGYRRDVLARWGDRVTFDALPFNPAAPTAEAAATQFGWDGRLCALLPQPGAADGIARAILAVAHPTVDPAMAFPGGRDRPEVAAMMQGASLLNLEKQGGRWIVADGGYQSRRLTAATLCRITGPAAASVGGSVQGLLAVSGGCATPWGTLLLAEGDPAPWSTRLGPLDARFRETRHFGWVVELDPLDPGAVPNKRTALARFPRGDAAAALSRDGRAVVYLTDRRAGGHLFRFVSDRAAAEPEALDAGTLAVARLAGDRLRWEALPRDAAVLPDPLAAAARLGATGFDRPDGLAVDGPGGRLFLACRGQAAPPRDGRATGSVLEILPVGGDHAAPEATLRPLLTGGGPSGLRLQAPEAPATLGLDGGGRLWIGTDQDGRVGAAPDALYGCDTQGAGRGLALPLYGAPRGAALGGSAGSPEGEALFVMVRTPGAEPGASYARPGTRWPSFEPGQPPRSALLAFTRIGGGRVGG